MTALEPVHDIEPDHELDRQAAAEGLTHRRGTTAGANAPLHDPAAERAAIASMLISLEACAVVIETGITASDFYTPFLGNTYTAIYDLLDNAGTPNVITIAAALDPAGTSDTRDRLFDLTAANDYASYHAHTYAHRIIHCANARRLQGAALEVAQAAATGDLPLAITKLGELTDAVPATLDDTIKHNDLGRFLASDEPEYDWLIPGLLERTDRVLLTGPEGGGKSTLLRQIAVQTSAGIHPFTHIDIKPLRVLLLDLENSERHVRRALRALRHPVGDASDHNLIIANHPQGLDLTQPDDVRALTSLITNVAPDLVIGGPIYKLVGGDPLVEEPAKAAAMTLDRLRVANGFALILETHQPHGTGSDRPERPYGASLWKRWPEFGLHISEAGLLRHWRGARDEREWPAALQRGGDWPWTMCIDSKTLTYSRITELVREHGRRLSERELVQLTGAPKTNVHNAIKANQARFDQLCDDLEKEAT